MSSLPALVKDLALILVVAGLVTLLFRRWRQPLVLGYIVAGFVVSPHMPYTMSVVDKADIHTWADIGVIFLLFSLGLDFSVKKILRMGMAPVIASLAIILSMSALGVTAGHALGWSRMDSLFLGGMLSMSSTTIIYKAFDDMGLRQQRFAGLVMSVLILEDILAIVLMVMLSAIAGGRGVEGWALGGQLLRIALVLVVWFVVGISAVPLFLRRTRRMMNDETLTVVALGLCCAMAWVATLVGLSSAFGAFVMGSILAETVEAERIIRLVEPVKNLFGAIFFVSVGMLADPQILIDYALPIVALVLLVLAGQSSLGSLGYLLSGQPLGVAMRCGFSMAQIGEFAFIIASLGLALGVISDFLYPVVVAVSIITTFLTPYMIRWSVPAAAVVERGLPRRWQKRLVRLTATQPMATADEEHTHWRHLLRQMLTSTLVYGALSAAVVALQFSVTLPFLRTVMPAWWARGVCGVVTVALIAPFLRSIIMRHSHGDDFRALWTGSRSARLPLLATILLRVAVAAGFLFYISHRLARFTPAVVITLALVIIILLVLSRRLKRSSIQLERLFIQNLRSRETAAAASRPRFAQRLLSRDLHISDFEVPADSTLAGQTLRELRLRERFGLHVSSILRGRQSINIPGGEARLFPGDRVQAIGSDEQLRTFARYMKSAVATDDGEAQRREMRLRAILITRDSPLAGQTLAHSGIREHYGCMVVGIDDGEATLTPMTPTRRFEPGDVVWIVGEEGSVRKIE